MRGLVAVLTCVACFAQTAPPAAPDVSGDAVFRSNISVVIAPTTVLDKKGNYVNGLQLQDFTLYDNGKPQRITQDVSFEPLSLVLDVQTSALLDQILPKVQLIGNNVMDLVAGQDGEVGIIAFDGRVRTIQDFTNDGTKLKESLRKLTVGNSSARLIDSITESVRMLKRRPDTRRKVILCISERRDRASEGRLREAMEEAQFANVTIYSVNISHILAQITGKAAPLPPNNTITTVAQHVPEGAAQTPSTIDIGRTSGNFIPLFQSIFLATKSLFVDDTLDVFTRYTGGKEYYFIKQHGLEQAISAIGEDLHSQYLLSYTPNNQTEGGFHDIKVEVNRPGLEVRTRPGYWKASLVQ